MYCIYCNTLIQLGRGLKGPLGEFWYGCILSASHSIILSATHYIRLYMYTRWKGPNCTDDICLFLLDFLILSTQPHEPWKHSFLDPDPREWRIMLGKFCIYNACMEHLDILFGGWNICLKICHKSSPWKQRAILLWGLFVRRVHHIGVTFVNKFMWTELDSFKTKITLSRRRLSPSSAYRWTPRRISLSAESYK